MASTSGMDRATTSPALTPKAEEAHRQHDSDGFAQGFGELADGFAHHLGLVRHQIELDADGELLLQPFGRLMQALAEIEIVATGAHVDAVPIAGLPLMRNILVGGSL